MTNLVSGIWRDETKSLVLSIQNDYAPTDEEWNEYCANITLVLSDPNAAGVSLTDGGAPNSAQRDRVRETIGPHTGPSAVITRSLLARGVVTALSWFRPKTAAFTPERAHEAMQFAGLRADQVPGVCDAIRALDERLHPQSRVVSEMLEVLLR
jgi:hypothetical protein